MKRLLIIAALLASTSAQADTGCGDVVRYKANGSVVFRVDGRLMTISPKRYHFIRNSDHGEKPVSYCWEPWDEVRRELEKAWVGTVVYRLSSQL